MTKSKKRNGLNLTTLTKGEWPTKVVLYYLPLFILVIFILVPLFAMIRKGFTDDGHFTLRFYKEVLSSASFKTSLLHSLVVGIVVSFLCTLVSTFYAIVLYYSKSRCIKTILTFIVLVSLISPPFVSSLSYIQLYGRRGLITNGLLHLSLNPYNVYGIILMQVISFAPFNIIFLLGFMKNISSFSINAGRSLGANDSRILRDVIIPSIRSSLLSLFMLTFIRSISDYATPIVIGGRYNTIASDIYLQMIGYSNLNKVSVLNMSIMIPSVIAFIFYYMEEHKTALFDRNLRVSSTDSFSVFKAGILGIVMIIFTIIVAIMSFLQYAAILFSSFFKYTKNGYKFTAEYINTFLKADMSSIVRSIVYSFIVIMISMVLALFLSYYITRVKTKKSHFTEILTLLPYTIAGPTFGIAYLLAFNHKPLYITGTAIIVILNMTFKQFPVSYRIIEDSLRSINLNEDKSALSLGASKFRVLNDIILPEMREGFFSLFVYNFSTSMTTAGAIIFLITPSKQLAVFKLFDAVYVGDYGRASVIATAIILIVAVFEGIFALLIKHTKRVKERRVYVS